MKLQESILKTFKEYYPSMTLNESAKLLNINRTRLFRIMNGMDMKVSEYESFENAILEAQGLSTSNFLTTAKDCLRNLKPEKLSRLMDPMNERLLLNSMVIQ